MGHVFQARVRRVGNSLGVIIPAEVISSLTVAEGDDILVTADVRERTAADMVRELAGRYPSAERFRREKRDRF